MIITFRRMQLEDVSEIFSLEQAIFKDAWSLEHFIAEVENTDVSNPILMLDGIKIIGYAVVWKFEDEAHINNFAVAPESRRRGYGAQLLSHVLTCYKECNHIFLEVRNSNLAAVGLYEKFGFRQVDLRKKYYSDGEDALIMHRFSGN